MTSFAQPTAAGAEYRSNGTSFRLWAPAVETVELVVEGRSPEPMRRQPDGWFETMVSATPGDTYRFRLPGGLLVPDPASRRQVEDVHGPSVVVDPRAFRWRHGDWKGRPWEETVLYELHPGACGGFRGIAARLPALRDLGVTAVELMPVNDFPGSRNWGYDGVLPYAPDRAYGAPEDLKALVDEAHGLGLMIFLDVVYNHFGPDGNYLHAYAPQMFRTDLSTPWGAAIDFRRPEVRRFFTDNALYWLMEYRFDGLRFDAVHAISEPDWLDEMAATVRRTVEPDRHVHLVLEHDGNIASHLLGEFDAQWNDDAHHVLHVLLTGEDGGYYADYAAEPAKRLARALRDGFIYQGEPSAHRGGQPRGTPSADLPPTAFVLFLQNHDQIGNRALGERLTTLARPAALEAAAALQLLAPHIPLIFMGEEWGSETPFLYFTDHHGDLAEAVRDGRRKEFASFKAFADPEARAKIPDPNDPDTFQRSIPDPAQARDPARADRLDLYRTLLRLRHRFIVPRLKGTKALAAHAVGERAVLAQWRLGDGSALTIATNLGGDPVPITAPQGQLLFATGRNGAASIAKGLLPAEATIAVLDSTERAAT